MSKLCKLISKYIILFLIGGCIYYSTEITYRGYSHWTMFILGGICFLSIGCINEILPWNMWIELQVAIGTFIVLILEFITGCIVNIELGWHVWDYSNMPFNLLGQICPQFALLWVPLVLIAIMLDDHIRYRLFGEEKPRYHSCIL